MKSKELDNYTVYENGSIWSKRKQKYLKPSLNNAGYLQVNLNGKFLKVHRIVFKCFNGSIPDNMEVDHIDGDKTNNNASNLQLLTHSQNIQKTYNQGRIPLSGENHPHYNKTFSKSTRVKMSESKKGKNHPKFKGFYIIDGIKYESAREAAKHLDIAAITVIRRCKSNKYPNYIAP